MFNDSRMNIKDIRASPDRGISIPKLMNTERNFSYENRPMGLKKQKTASNRTGGILSENEFDN